MVSNPWLDQQRDWLVSENLNVETQDYLLQDWGQTQITAEAPCGQLLNYNDTNCLSLDRHRDTTTSWQQTPAKGEIWPGSDTGDTCHGTHLDWHWCTWLALVWDTCHGTLLNWHWYTWLTRLIAKHHNFLDLWQIESANTYNKSQCGHTWFDVHANLTFQQTDSDTFDTWLLQASDYIIYVTHIFHVWASRVALFCCLIVI